MDIPAPTGYRWRPHDDAIVRVTKQSAKSVRGVVRVFETLLRGGLLIGTS